MSSSSDQRFVPRDSVDALLDAWRERRPDLDFSPVGVVSRLGRVRGHVDAALDQVFSAHGLSAADFAVLVTLARIEGDQGVSQRRLMRELGLTSGTISVRMDRLVDAALVERRPDPRSGRNTLITTTARGRRLFERVVPAHLENERRLLAALTDEERELLAGLLRKLLVEFEGSQPTAEAPQRLGLTVAPAHAAIALRESVGLPPVAALLVRAVAEGGPGARAGVRPGDALRKAGRRELRSVASLYAAIEDVAGSGRLRVELLRGLEAQRVTIRLDSAAGGGVALASSAGRAGRGEHLV